MSVPRLLVVTAVPFSLARLQSNFNPYTNNNSTPNTTTNSKDSNKNHSNFKRMIVSAKQNVTNDKTNTRLINKRNRILKNRISSQISREKAKIKKDLLEKQLLELQIEQMKIRLLNNELEMQQSKLEKENAILKERISQFIDNPQGEMEENVTDTFNHAEKVGSVSSSFHPHSSFGRVYEQPSESKFFQLIDGENSTHNYEKQQGDDTSYCLPEVAEKLPQKEHLCLENEIDSSDDFNLIESMIFGDGFDFCSTNPVSLMKGHAQFSNHGSDCLANIQKKFYSEEKSMPCDEKTFNVPEWTFQDLYDDIENTSLCSF